MNQPKKNTLLFPLRDGRVLLGMKKRGFGAGWWNGFGGKVEPGETFELATRREVYEEVGLRITEMHLVARVLFYFDDRLDILCKTYASETFEGKPVETEEMRPQWFAIEHLPFDTMWEADRLWVPQALAVRQEQTAKAFAVYFDKGQHFLKLNELAAHEIDRYFADDAA